MRILIYGAGVLGCNLANDLFRSGKDVTLLARGKWAEEINKNGLCIKNTFSLMPTTTHIPVIDELKKDDIYDVIFVVVRYTQLDSVIKPISENGSKNIVLVGNNVRADYYRNLLASKNVMFAFYMTAGERRNGRVESIDTKKIKIGQLCDSHSNEKFIREIFDKTKCRVDYEPNMGDYLLSHAAFVIPAAFICYYSGGDLHKLKNNTEILNRLIDANIEGYRAVEKSGHEILPVSDKNYESDKYRRFCMRFFKFMFATNLGKICASTHAFNAAEEISTLNRDIKQLFAKTDVKLDAWESLEKQVQKYL